MIIFEGEVLKGSWIPKQISSKADNLKLSTLRCLGVMMMF